MSLVCDFASTVGVTTLCRELKALRETQARMFTISEKMIASRIETHARHHRVRRHVRRELA